MIPWLMEISQKFKNTKNTKHMMKKREGESHASTNPVPFSSSSSFPSIPPSLLPPHPSFNSPHPSFPGHGVAKRIMGNEMAYLRLPRGEIEREREREKERVRDKTKRVGKRRRGGKSARQRQKETLFLALFLSSVCPTNNAHHLNIISPSLSPSLPPSPS